MSAEAVLVEAYNDLEALLDAQITFRSPWSSDYNLKLERVSALVEALSNPQFQYPTVHVGGTSGKGTVAALTSAVLSAHGKRIGLHLSPFVQTLTETWQVDGRYLDPPVVLDALRSVLAVELPESLESTHGKPSYFELKVATAFLLFSLFDVDAAVVEVGLGGALDATNVLGEGIKVLTNVGLDHTEVLGNSVEQIASDKVEIFKPGSTVVSGVTQQSVRRIVERKAAETGSRLYLLGDNVRTALDQGVLKIETPDHEIVVPVPLRWPAYQVRNAALALVAADLQIGDLDSERSAMALSSVRLPGRFEVIDGGRPAVVLDGAHNLDKLDAVATRLSTEYPGRKVAGVLAVKRGKDVSALVRRAATAFDDVVVTTFHAPPWEAVDPIELADEFSAVKFRGRVRVEADPRAAVGSALEFSDPSGVLLVTGSLYLVGNVRGLWRPLSAEIANGCSYLLP
jgi:dihydrofolate synthase/folylpolyglutamate synthase